MTHDSRVRQPGDYRLSAGSLLDTDYAIGRIVNDGLPHRAPHPVRTAERTHGADENHEQQKISELVASIHKRVLRRRCRMCAGNPGFSSRSWLSIGSLAV